MLPKGNRPDLIAILPGFNKKIEIEGVTVINKEVRQDKLAEFYRGAIGFIFPSLHETFGLPIIEAMACGCPVITSNITACPEIAGDAAMLVSPRNVKEISNAMRTLAGDESVRADLRRKGIIRAEMFSWDKCAKEHLEIFEKAARLK